LLQINKIYANITQLQCGKQVVIFQAHYIGKIQMEFFDFFCTKTDAQKIVVNAIPQNNIRATEC